MPCKVANIPNRPAYARITRTLQIYRMGYSIETEEVTLVVRGLRIDQ